MFRVWNWYEVGLGLMQERLRANKVGLELV